MQGQAISRFIGSRAFFDARSNLESVITLRSKGYRDLLLFDVIEVCLFSMGVSVFFFARTLDC